MLRSTVHIGQERATEELENMIALGFQEYALDTIGVGGSISPFTFVARTEENFVGAVQFRTFYGAIHIKNLFVVPEWRGKGVGSQLLESVLEKGRDLGMRFAFIETFNFQAVEFYKKFGFVEEFCRKGFAQGATFHYLRKDFPPHS